MVKSLHCRIALTLIFGCLLFGKSAVARETWIAWPTVGQAEFTWLWFDVYQSTLRTPDGHFHGLSSDLTLEIRYQRQISAEQLLDATEKQWVAMGYSEESINNWLASLSQLFPTVSVDDTLYFVLLRDHGSLYFSQQGQSPQLLGDVHDIDLCHAFLSIWLGVKTQYPNLRKQLIGE